MSTINQKKKTDSSKTREKGQFSVGEVLEIKGVPFIIQRINRSNIVLRPVTTGAQRAKDIIRKISTSRNR